MQFDKGPSWASVGLRGLALTTLGVGIHLQAQAVGLNQMNATASENAVVTDSHNSGASMAVPVTAAVNNADGEAAASASILQVQASALSKSLQTNHFDGSAAQWSSFTFWNTATHSVYQASGLAGRSLTVDFALQGDVTMPGAPTGGHARSTSYTYSTELYTSGFAGHSGGGSLACGPSGCSGTGEVLQMGSNLIDTHFALTSAISAATGSLYSYLLVGDGGGTSSALTLRIAGASLSGGAGLPLALRFDDGSQLAVSSVPEPQSILLILAGLAVVWGGSKLQRRA